MQFSRRDFLIACGSAGALAFSRDKAASSSDGPPFHLHPSYREHLPLEPVLAKRVAGSDRFVLEAKHDRIARILASWSDSLRLQTGHLERLQNVLSPSFRGCSFQIAQRQTVRQDSLLEVAQVSFAHGAPADFLSEWKSYSGAFARVITADFQITGITEEAGTVITQIRYELVGEGAGFYREQRVGTWELRWNDNSDGYRLAKWRTGGEARSRSLSPLFADVTRHTLGGNPSYAEQLSRGTDYWRTVIDGASHIDIYGHNGISVGDVTGDGLDDVYICQPAGLPNRLYRNRGDGTFEDITESSETGLLENTACALFADISNRGCQDLIVVRASGPLLFENDGKGKFTAKPNAFHFAGEPLGTFTGASLADYDRDGWLDIYFCLYVYYQGTDQYKYPTPYYDANNGPPNFLFRNNRDGTFRDVTTEAGLNQNNTRYSFCCGWTDIDSDGWPDLCVVNDFGKKNLYRNNRNGTFTDVAAEAGAEDIGAGMSVCGLDFDNDGLEDLHIADMWTAAGSRIADSPEFQKDAPEQARSAYRKHAMGNSLLRNKGNGSFTDATATAHASMGRWSWSSDAWDFDHDGHPDLYVTNGMISGPMREDLNSFFWRQVVANSPNESRPSEPYEQGWSAINELIRADYTWSGYERNVFYANNGDGTFSDVSGAIGLDFREDGRSFALADFDGDGRLELFLKNRNAPQFRVLKNVAKELPPSISFRLRGTKSNRDAIGAAVTIETSAGRQTRRLQAGSGFLSQHTKELFFGLGRAEGAVNASIRWPSGLVQQFGNLPPNHRVHIEEGSALFHAEPFRAAAAFSSEALGSEELPDRIETWLLSPVPAPVHAGSGKISLLYLWSSESNSDPGQISLLRERLAPLGLHIDALDLASSVDDAAILNILISSLFDRHRDLTIPTSLLIDEHGDVAKVYQGVLNIENVQRDFRDIPKSDAARLDKALPFRGNASTYEFRRNHLSLGSIYFQRGYFQQAGIWFQRALSDNPSSAEAHYGLGSVQLKQGDRAAAQGSFEQAVKSNADYPDTKPNAWNNLGLLAARANNLKEAIGFFKEALLLSPDHVISLLNLGNAYRQEQRWDEALQNLQHAVEIQPDNPEVNYGIGMVFAQTDRPDAAYTHLKRALELRPTYPEAMNNLGVLYLRTRRPDQAIAEFEACIRTAPEFDRAYLNLARVYVVEGNPERAREVLSALLQKHPDHVEARRALEEIH